MDKMKTVTVKFVVHSNAHADDLINEIAEDIGNHYGVPFIFSEITDSTDDEIAAANEQQGDLHG
jgi:hypothetical protein